MTKTRFVAVSLLLGIASCTTAALDDTGAEPLGQDREEIRNGIGVLPTLDAVVLLDVDDSTGVGSIGSGTMLTAEWILTAAHVVDTRTGSGAPSFQLPSAIKVRWGNQSDASAQVRSAVAVYHHPSFVIGQVSYPTTPSVVDAALVRVDPPFTGALTRTLSTAATSTYVGTSLYCLGYGLTQEGGSISGSLLHAFLPLASASTNHARVDPGLSILGSTIGLQGDSGGPCMDALTGAIVGIFSSQDPSPPVDFNYLSPTSSFRTWAQGIMSSCTSLTPGSSSFCSTSCPCTYGAADCESGQCGPGMDCDMDVGSAFGLAPNYDVCVESACTSGVQSTASYCSDGCPCGYGGGDCDGNSQCMGGLTCVNDIGPAFNQGPTYDVCVYDACVGGTLGSSTFCSSGCPCGYGGGDCDSNSQCMPGMTCATDYGPAFDMSSATEVCVATGCETRTLYASDFCSHDCPCGHGGGDCDDDGDCMPGLECGTNNGPEFGQPDTWDICVRP